MSLGWALIIVVGTELLLLFVGFLYFIHQNKTKEPFPQPEDWGSTPDDRRWEKEAAELPHAELSSVREAAKNWAASIAALLTIGGTVGLVKGEEAFSKLTTGEGNFAFWLTVSAAVLAGAAIAFATFAAQGAPSRYKSIDGWTLRQITARRSLDAMRWLTWSRIFVVVAALAVLATLAISWSSGIASEEPQASGVEAVATTVDGRARCGVLHTTATGGLWLTAGRYTDQVAPRGAVTVVDSCPSGP